jgi:nicotinamidase-related amidase
MSKKALIVVDMLNDFIDENGALYCGETVRAIVPFIRERIDRYRRQGAAVIYLRDAHDAHDKEFEKFPRHCVAGTWGSEVISALAPLAGEPVVNKKRYSGFYGTDLEKILLEKEIGAVEVVGVCTSICVMDTVGGLANRDYPVSVPVKGVADFDAEFHEFALKRMAQLYGARII